MGKIKSTTRRALTTLICLSFSIITLSARTIEVGEGKAFSSINAALHKAKAKDEILIYGKKIYKERLVKASAAFLTANSTNLLVRICALRVSRVIPDCDKTRW